MKHEHYGNFSVVVTTTTETERIGLEQHMRRHHHMGCTHIHRAILPEI